MPETHAEQDILIEEPQPVVSSFPLRQGEEKHAATLGLEHERRRDSELDELKAQVAKLSGMAVPMKKFTEGVSAQNRRRILAAKVNELKQLTRKVGNRWEGPAAPATVVNFNPLRLGLQGELQHEFVPAAGAKLAKKVTFPFNGRRFEGSYVTFTNAHVWPVIIGTENIEGFDSPSIRADYISPIGIAYQFFEHYVTGAIDAMGMGGVLIFEGDIHVLDRARQEATEGNILIPEKDMEAGTAAHPVYKVVEKSLFDILGVALLQQRRYAEGIIAEGHRFYNSPAPEEQKQRSEYHTLWHNWAMDRGYKTEPEEWATERLSDSPNVQAVSCPSCSTRQIKPDQHFCPNCNAPFDAFAAYMAGMPVPEVWLSRYDGEKWDKIIAESARRKAKVSVLTGDDSDRKKGK